jgi:3-hydroxyisobutyrate dehydrogenase-like beta-hydroxyacid dehydrogenase
MTIKRIGVVGLDSIGMWITHRLVGAGFHVTVTDRARERMGMMGDAGFKTATLPADVAQDADMVLMSVRGDRNVDDMLFDHGGVVETLPEGSYLLDTSATSPQFSQAASERLAGFGLTRAEGCLIADPERAGVGNWCMLFGGSSGDLSALSEVIGVLATRVVHTGSVGTASRLKAIHQELLDDGFSTAARGLAQALLSKPLEGTPVRTQHGLASAVCGPLAKSVVAART